MRLNRSPWTAALVVSASAILATSAPVLVAGGAAAAVVVPDAPQGPECMDTALDSAGPHTVKGDNVANAILHVAQAQALARKDGAEPGRGVRIVVVDSGIGGYDGTPADLPSGHGTAVAGILKGADQTEPTAVEVGIAPAVTLEDAPFYQVPVKQQEGDVVPTSSGLAGRLATIPGPGKGDHLIVLVPTQVARSSELVAQVDRLTQAGALVIAASGDRPRSDEEFPSGYAGESRKGEDTADLVWPAAHPAVIGVGVSTPGSRGAVLRSSAIDLAAPGVGAVSRARNGAWCVLSSPSTAWAAAEVAGVAALAWSLHPDEDATVLRTRLEQTASGNGGQSSPLIGFGVVQPVEAIQRDVAEMGTAQQERVRPARAPRPRADVLAGARHDAVWWGLGGASALVILLVLRPLFARRRPDQR